MHKSCKGCGLDFDPLDTQKLYCIECSRNGKYKLVRADGRTRYSRVKNGAKLRGIPFELPYEEFAEFYGLPCVYCGDATDTINLDRIDSGKGYLFDNVVPCCPECNHMKGTKSLPDFIQKIKRIASNF